MQIHTFCWLPLRRGALIISAACFVMAVLNVVSAALPLDNDHSLVITRSVHAVLAIIYAAAGALLALAIYQGSVALVRLWLALFAVLALASLLAHDLARYDWVELQTNSAAAVVTGIGLFNIVLDVVFLMAVYALLREMEREKEEDVAAASRPRPRAAPGAPSVAPALPLRDIIPPARAPSAILNGAIANGGPELRNSSGHLENGAVRAYDIRNGRVDGRDYASDDGDHAGNRDADGNFHVTNGDCSEGNDMYIRSHLYPRRVDRNDNWENRERADVNGRIINGHYVDGNGDGNDGNEVDETSVHGFVNNAYSGPQEVRNTNTFIGMMNARNKERISDQMEI